MGYNGGTNKRGYYRRYNGMYSKSSSKSGSKIFANTILGGLGLISAIGGAIADSASDISYTSDIKSEHFNPKKQRTKIIICSIIAVLCPIAGFVTFQYAYWWMFCSVLLFGFIEMAVCFSMFRVKGDIKIDLDYIYGNELEETEQRCKTNMAILRTVFLILFVLNLYPIAMFIFGLDPYIIDVGVFAKYSWDGGETSIPIILVLLKLAINLLLIIESFRGGVVVNCYGKIIDNSPKNETIIENHDNQENEISVVHGPAIDETDIPDEIGTDQNIQCTNEESIESDDLNQDDENTDQDLEEVQPVEINVSSKIQSLISTDWKVEEFFYFSMPLMTEECYDKQKFSPRFKQTWFLYEEYKKYWTEAHPQLMFYAKAHKLAEDIIKNDIISINDFKDQNIYDELVHELLRQRLTKEEFKIYETLNNNKKIPYECVALNYLRCRGYKLEYETNRDSIETSLGYSYGMCVDTILHTHGIFGYTFGKLIKFMKEEEEIHDSNFQDTSDTSTNLPNITLPEISGEYVETFKFPYGKLRIHANSASIDFYFPGPDARYRGTHFTIFEDDIDKYIRAYQNNWNTALELQKKAEGVPNTEFKQSGEMNMRIVATGFSITIYLYQHHLPIYEQKECEEMVLLLQRAKLRIKEVRSKLFK